MPFGAMTKWPFILAAVAAGSCDEVPGSCDEGQNCANEADAAAGDGSS